MLGSIYMSRMSVLSSFQGQHTSAVQSTQYFSYPDDWRTSRPIPSKVRDGGERGRVKQFPGRNRLGIWTLWVSLILYLLLFVAIIPIYTPDSSMRRNLWKSSLNQKIRWIMLFSLWDSRNISLTWILPSVWLKVVPLLSNCRYSVKMWTLLS